MKTLIEDSVVIYGLGKPSVKSIFNSNDPSVFDYRDISIACNRKLTCSFNYDEDGTKKSDKIALSVIPNGLDELGVKNFIIAEINTYLA